MNLYEFNALDLINQYALFGLPFLVLLILISITRLKVGFRK